MVHLRLIIVLAAVGGIGAAEDRGGELRGSVTTHSGEPVSQAQVEAREQSGKKSAQFATTALDGIYVLRKLPPGIYNLRITATGFYPAEVRDVQVDQPAVRLPVVPLEIGLIADCGADSPAYYRVAVGAAESGALAGVVLSDQGVPVQGAAVTLYMKGKGGIRSESTADDGTFHFSGLQVHSAEYWVSIERDGFFPEEQRHLFVLPGFESVYSPITMESCSPGNCQPYLKTIRVVRGCA